MEKHTKHLLDIALKDIKASQLLYQNKLYAQSFFYFQQATEKTYKAFGLFGKILSVDDMKNINHSPLSIYRKILTKEKENISKMLYLLDLIPGLKEHEFLVPFDFQSYRKQLEREQSFLDRLWNLKQFEISDHVDILKELKTIEKEKLDLPQNYRDIFQEGFIKAASFVETIDPSSGAEMKLELAREETVKEYTDINVWMLKVSLDLGFISYVLFMCAAITMSGHAETTRYPINGINALVFYSMKYTGTKFQLEYLKFLKKAILKIKKIQLESTIEKTR